MERADLKWYPQFSIRVPVHCTIGDRSFQRVADTLSGGGLFLTESEGLEPGNELSVSFRPDKHLPVIQAKANVRFIVPGQGAAVEFTEISPEDRLKLLRFIHQKTGNRRESRRAPLATQVECDRCMSLAFSRDVCPGGMFIETKIPLPVGSPLTVRFNLNNKDTVVTATANVAYHIEKMGMGILFTKISPQDSDAIREYVESTQSLTAEGSAGSESD